MEPTTSTGLFGRYLKLLGVEPSAPTLDLLKVLVRNHLERIPFENISKLYYLRRFGLRGVPDLELYIDGIVRYHFGGTCYSNNVHLNRLLRHLGFEVDLCGADMSEPDVHIVNLVRVEGREYLVDVGYGAPFFEPLPRDIKTDLVVDLGNERWVVKQTDDRGRTVVEHHRQGKRIHGYTARPAPRDLQHFAKVILGSFHDDSTFMNTVRLVWYGDEGCTAIAGGVLYQVTPEAWTLRRLVDQSDLVDATERHFGIPSAIVREGFAVLRNVQLR